MKSPRTYRIERKYRILTAMVITVVVSFLMVPVKVNCGIPSATCTPAPNDNGVIERPYDIEPIGIFILESITKRNISFQYREGYESETYRVQSDSHKLTFETKSTRINLYFNSSNYRIGKSTKEAYPEEGFTGQRYLLNGGPVRNYYIDYWNSVADLKKKTDFTKNRDKDNPGMGCFTDKESISIYDNNFQKVTCYYNPLGSTNSGRYIPGTSTVLHTDCVYRLEPKVSGAIRFWGVAEIGHNTCNFIKNELKDFGIEVNSNL